MILDTIALPENHIAAGRFVLRPAQKSDAGLFAMYAGDKRVAEGTQSIPHPLPPGAAEAFYVAHEANSEITAALARALLREGVIAAG